MIWVSFTDNQLGGMLVMKCLVVLGWRFDLVMKPLRGNFGGFTYFPNSLIAW